MKTFSWSLLMLVFSITMISLTGCGDVEPKVKSMTDGVELSEIEAYEQAVRGMEAEDAGDMENIETTEPAPAE
jgi:uncharacterized lipoprotein YehR (DUF1307 family)